MNESERQKFNRVLDDFRETEITTQFELDMYFGFARNILAGHHTELSLTGNAFHVRFSANGVAIEYLWLDEDALDMSLQAFLDFLAGVDTAPTRQDR